MPGPSTEFFGRLASNCSVHLCIPLVEVHDRQFFNSQVLVNARGEIIAHHRKKNPWPPGDALWVSEGDLPVQVVDTEFGRIGLMICYDVHVLPKQLAQKHADLVLYSIGWFGPNADTWFRNTFTARFVKLNGFAVIGANWTGDGADGSWPGQGFSFIADQQGTILSMADDSSKPQIIYARLQRPEQ